MSMIQAIGLHGYYNEWEGEENNSRIINNIFYFILQSTYILLTSLDFRKCTVYYTVHKKVNISHTFGH